MRQRGWRFKQHFSDRVPMHSTASLRHTLKAQRLALPSAAIATASFQFLEVLKQFFADISPPQSIGIYLAGKGELDLKPSTQWLWQQGHWLYAPVLAGESLLFCEYTQNTPLGANRFGLMEPTDHKAIAATRLDYVLVPGVAFDQQGNRLGMGKGYYDRSFAFRKTSHKPILIGCAYSFQCVTGISAKPHDIKMDFILRSS